ncbi:MAG: hypothetical protein V1800_13240 [Candidatus Latescibacterota bacterium]
MSQGKILFTDWQHIECGHVSWLNAQGERVGIGTLPEEQVPLHASPGAVPHGIRLVAQPAQKTDPVDAWKGWGRILFDGGRYRSWYLEINGVSKLGSGSAAHVGPLKSVVICAVESEDGFCWTEPKRCAIHAPGHRGFDGVTFFIDPKAPPAERYKLIYCATFPENMYREELEAYLRQPERIRDSRISPEHRYGLFAAASPDGLQWTAMQGPLSLHPSDTDTTVLWDDAIGKYVMYTRMFREERRWIGRAEADSLTHWGSVEPIIWPRLDDPPDRDFYLNGYSRYPGLPEVQLMFPMVWHRFTERSEVRLYSSADGIAWNQIPGGPVIEPGEPGTWDSEFIGSGKDLLPFGKGRIAIPYSGTSYPHKHPRWPAVWDAWKMAWAWWPADRLCALKADFEGVFSTMPMVPGGRVLRLNCRTPMAGEIRVGIHGIAGRATDDCDPIVGDHADAVVTWHGKTDPGVAEDQPITLTFKLRAAELFALEWTEGA